MAGAPRSLERLLVAGGAACASNQWRTTGCFAARTSSSRPTAWPCGADLIASGSSRASRRDREHRLDERVERLLRLGLGRLDHQRLWDDEREVDGRRVEAVVHQPLRDVERADPVLALERARAEHELVHAEAVVREVVGLAQPSEHVVRVQHRDLAHLAQARPPRAHEGVRADEDAERAAEAAHLADRARPVVVEPEAVTLPHDDGHRQERLEALPHCDRPAAGAAAAVGLRERLVQVDVDDVEAHVARPRDPADRVQVRAVVDTSVPRPRGRCRGSARSSRRRDPASTGS